MLWLYQWTLEKTMSHYRALGGGQMNGVDACCQSFLQIVKDVGADAGAGCWTLSRERFIQQLLEGLKFNQQHHVLQEITFDESCKLCSTKELHHKDKNKM